MPDYYQIDQKIRDTITDTKRAFVRSRTAQLIAVALTLLVFAFVVAT